MLIHISIFLLMQAKPLDQGLNHYQRLYQCEAIELLIANTKKVPETPEPYAFLINQLGSSCYACREMATKKLARMSWGDPQWVLRARHDRDPNIRFRCNQVMKLTFKCWVCFGRALLSGIPCSICGGLGTIWKNEMVE